MLAGVFNDRKSTGSLPWVHGKHVRLSHSPLRRHLTVCCIFLAGSGKSVPWFVNCLMISGQGLLPSSVNHESHL